jgi:bifunctional non-homologous end joining protein LigD
MLMRTPHRWIRPKRLQPPGFIVPCQPTLADRVPTGEGWVHELKHDGRILAFKEGDTVRLWSRNGRDWSGDVAITDAMQALPFKRVMIDGEAVAHCLDGLPDFHWLLGDGQATACFYAFDLLWLEAQDLRGLELIGRRRMLQTKALKTAGPVLRFSEHLEGSRGEAMFRHACAMGLEGIVSKRATSRYRSGRCTSWMKVKNPAYRRQPSP